MKNYKTKKEMIIDKTLQLIGEKGTSDISIRDITEAANINVGAVNYHFQNKENLFKAVEQLYISNMNRIFITLDADKTPRELLLDCGVKVMEFIQQYPGILVVIKEDLQKDYNDRASVEVHKQSNANIKKLNMILDQFLSSHKEEDLVDLKMMIISSVLFPSSSFIKFFGKKQIKRFSSKKQRLEYLTNILDNFSK